MGFSLSNNFQAFTLAFQASQKSAVTLNRRMAIIRYHTSIKTNLFQTRRKRNFMDFYFIKQKFQALTLTISNVEKQQRSCKSEYALIRPRYVFNVAVTSLSLVIPCWYGRMRCPKYSLEAEAFSDFLSVGRWNSNKANSQGPKLPESGKGLPGPGKAIGPQKPEKTGQITFGRPQVCYQPPIS